MWHAWLKRTLELVPGHGSHSLEHALVLTDVQGYHVASSEEVRRVDPGDRPVVLHLHNHLDRVGYSLELINLNRFAAHLNEPRNHGRERLRDLTNLCHGHHRVDLGEEPVIAEKRWLTLGSEASGSAATGDRVGHAGLKIDAQRHLLDECADRLVAAHAISNSYLVSGREFYLSFAIIGWIRQQALGSPLLSYEERVERSLKRVMAMQAWTKPQQKWLDRIASQLKKEAVVDDKAFEEGAFKTKGGFKGVDRQLGGKLDQVLDAFGDLFWMRSVIWEDAA